MFICLWWTFSTMNPICWAITWDTNFFNVCICSESFMPIPLPQISLSLIFQLCSIHPNQTIPEISVNLYLWPSITLYIGDTKRYHWKFCSLEGFSSPLSFTVTFESLYYCICPLQIVPAFHAYPFINHAQDCFSPPVNWS